MFHFHKIQAVFVKNLTDFQDHPLKKKPNPPKPPNQKTQKTVEDGFGFVYKVACSAHLTPVGVIGNV